MSEEEKDKTGIDPLVAKYGTAENPKMPGPTEQYEDSQKIADTGDNAPLISAEDKEFIAQEIEAERKYGESPIMAAALGAASAGSIGVSDQLLVKLGIMDKDELQQYYARNPGSTTVGEIGGTILPALLSGGSSLAAKGVVTAGKGAATAFKAGKAAEQITAKTLNKIIKDTGNKKFAKEVIKKAVPLAAGSGVEAGFFATGQLVREDALGTAEFNAENMISSFGGGALIGGTLGLGFGTALPLLGKAGSVGGKIAKSKIADLTDESDAARKLFNISDSAWANMNLKYKKMADDLPDFIRTRMPNAKNQKEMLDQLLKNESAGMARQPQILDELEKLSTQNPAFRANKDEILTVANKYIDDGLDKIGSSTLSKDVAMRRELENYRYSLNLLKFSDDVFTPKVLNQLEAQAARLAKYEKTVGPSIDNIVGRDVKTLFKESIDDIATKIKNAGGEGAGLADELLKVKKDMHYAMTLKKYLAQGSIKSDEFFNAVDILATGAATYTMGPAAFAAIGAKKFFESNLYRRLTVTSKLEEFNQKITSYIDKSMKSLVLQTKKPVTATARGAQAQLSKSVLALTRTQDGKQKKPKDEQEAFRNIRKNVLELQTNPSKMEKRAISSVSGLSIVAPQTASAAQDVMIRAVNFLSEKMPKDLQIRLDGLNAPQEISDLEMSKIKRYISAIEAPLGVIDDLLEGTATPEQVEAVKVVFPDLYTRMQEKAMEYLADAKSPVPYSKKIMLGTLLQIPTDSSLRPDAFADLQNNFAGPDEREEARLNATAAQGQAPGKLSVTGLREMDIAARENSEAQNFVSRRRS